MPIDADPPSSQRATGAATSRLLAAFLGGDVSANASLGMILVATCAGIVALTVEALRPNAHQLATFLVAAGASVVVALPLWQLSWSSRSARGLLAFPVVALAALTTASALAHGIG